MSSDNEEEEFLREQALLSIKRKKQNVPEVSYEEMIIEEGPDLDLEPGSDVDEIEEVIVDESEDDTSPDEDALSLKSNDSFDEVLKSIETEKRSERPVIYHKNKPPDDEEDEEKKRNKFRDEKPRNRVLNRDRNDRDRDYNRDYIRRRSRERSRSRSYERGYGRRRSRSIERKRDNRNYNNDDNSKYNRRDQLYEHSPTYQERRRRGGAELSVRKRRDYSPVGGDRGTSSRSKHSTLKKASATSSSSERTKRKSPTNILSISSKSSHHTTTNDDIFKEESSNSSADDPRNEIIHKNSSYLDKKSSHDENDASSNNASSTKSSNNKDIWDVRREERLKRFMNPGQIEVKNTCVTRKIKLDKLKETSNKRKIKIAAAIRGAEKDSEEEEQEEEQEKEEEKRYQKEKEVIRNSSESLERDNTKRRSKILPLKASSSSTSNSKEVVPKLSEKKEKRTMKEMKDHKITIINKPTTSSFKPEEDISIQIDSREDSESRDILLDDDLDLRDKLAKRKISTIQKNRLFKNAIEKLEIKKPNNNRRVSLTFI